MPFVAFQVVLATVPYLALAVAGIILFNRKRNPATALLALGFAVVAVTQIYSAILVLALIPITGSPQGWAYALLRWGTIPSQWALILGSWFAAAGLLWYALTRARASPNNRWRGP